MPGRSRPPACRATGHIHRPARRLIDQLHRLGQKALLAQRGDQRVL
jgi:hypothetical protein